MFSFQLPNANTDIVTDTVIFADSITVTKSNTDTNYQSNPELKYHSDAKPVSV